MLGFADCWKWKWNLRFPSKQYPEKAQSGADLNCEYPVCLVIRLSYTL